MTDEAHRSQYSMLGANLVKGIPNSARIAYTGTPIDKTQRVFGDYIDKYTMRQSVEDGVMKLTFNRPEAMNALSRDMMNAFSESLEEAASSRAIGCVVVRGQGEKAFCAGGDVKSMAARSVPAQQGAVDVSGLVAAGRTHCRPP